MKLFSNATIYGIRAALFVASREDPSKYVPVREIAEYLNISYHFLAKVVQTLAQNELMISYRGPNGGVALARAPNKIALLDMIHAMEGKDFFTTCMLGLPGCGESVPCPLHEYWAAMRGELSVYFQETTLKTLGDKITAEQLRISS